MSNDGKAETPVLWPPHAKSWLIGKDSDAERDWGQEEKGTTEDEMAGWHHRLDGVWVNSWVWVNSGSWWWTGRPGVQQSMGSQRVGHDWATELNRTERVTALSLIGYTGLPLFISLNVFEANTQSVCFYLTFCFWLAFNSGSWWWTGGAWHAAVQGGRKGPDMTEWLNWTEPSSWPMLTTSSLSHSLAGLCSITVPAYFSLAEVLFALLCSWTCTTYLPWSTKLLGLPWWSND